jgi:DinB family protein
VNALIKEHGELLSETQSFRTAMLAQLTDGDLAYALPGNMTLGELCREMGETEHGYVAAFSRFEHEWGYRHPDPSVATSVAALRAWYEQLDGDLLAALNALTDDDIATRRLRGGGWASVTKEFHLYREALLIFYAKAGLYLRALDKPLSEEWIDWMG